MPLKPDWTLPLDTVDAVWSSAFPALLHMIWGDFVPGEDEDDGADAVSDDPWACFDEIGVPPKRRAEILDSPTLLRAWLDCRLKQDRVPTLKPDGSLMLPDGFRLSTWSGLVHTFVVYNGGLVLPHLPKSPYENGTWPVPDHPDGTPTDASGRPDEAAFVKGLRAHIARVHETTDDPAFRMTWQVRGTQITALRTAASVALLRLWRSSPDFGRGDPERRPERFCRLVLDAYEGFQATDAHLPDLLTDWLRVEPIHMMSADLGTYFNPEDGAGFFEKGGYAMFAPPPPPVYDGLLTPPRGDEWSDSHAISCSGYAARQAYATPCTCPSARRRFFVRQDEKVPETGGTQKPPESSQEAPREIAP